MTLFSCASDPTNNKDSGTNKQANEMMTDAKKPTAAAMDSMNNQMNRTAEDIEKKIEALNKAEEDLIKEFDMK